MKKTVCALLILFLLCALVIFGCGGSGTATVAMIAKVPKYAYVANAISNDVSQYTIGANGSLTSMTTATVAAGTAPHSVNRLSLRQVCRLGIYKERDGKERIQIRIRSNITGSWRPGDSRPVHPRMHGEHLRPAGDDD